MIGTQPNSMGTDTSVLESVAGDESNDSATRVSWEVKSVFGSIATESAAFVAGSIHPSSDGAICSGLRAGVVAGVIPRTLSDGRAKSCSS